jgi:hypothetical protein
MSDDSPVEKLYEYRTSTQNPPVIQGRAEFIERFIPQPEMQRLFGGFVRSRDWDAGQEYLGVWGVRTASRFRRILRERGASFIVEHCESPPFKIGVRDGTA